MRSTTRLAASNLATGVALTTLAAMAAVTLVSPSAWALSSAVRETETAPGTSTVQPGFHEHRLTLGFDLVLGFGQSPVAILQPPPSGSTRPFPVFVQRSVFVESFMLFAGVDVGRGFDVSLRAPYTFFSFKPDTVREGGAGLGNLELRGAYRPKTTPFPLTVSLAFVLPTAEGAAPSSIGPSSDQNDLNRHVANRVGSSTRGLEDDELYQRRRFGVVPRVSADLRFDALTVTPWLKIATLVDTSGSADSKLWGAMVVGTRVAYRLLEVVDLGFRAWAQVPLKGADDPKATVVLEPELRFDLGRFTPYVGVLIPLAGPLTDPRFTGVRIGFTAQP